MTIYATKYVLTKGILKFDNAEVCTGQPNMIKVEWDNGYKQYFHGEGRDWHRTLAGAQVQAEIVRARKLLALEKQAKKLRALKF